MSGAVGADSSAAPSPQWPNPNIPATPVRLSCLVSPAAAASELAFVRQLGATHVFTWIEPEQCSVEFVAAWVGRVHAAGLAVSSLSCRKLGKNPDVILGTERRGAAIAAFVDFLHVLSAAGVGTTVFTWEPDGVWSTHSEVTRGGATCRAMDAGVLAKEPLTRGRPYTDDELFANMEHFLKKVLPHAERLDVRLALHPNDPPVPAIGGVACLMRSVAAFRRVFALAPRSKHLGMEFCCGCALEGGEAFGDLMTDLPRFVRDGRVFNVHLRNVTCALPKFAETYIDGGYGNVYNLLRCLHQAGYDGTVILDHSPPFEASAGEGAPTAFAVGYMKACLAAAAQEHPHPHPHPHPRPPARAAPET